MSELIPSRSRGVFGVLLCDIFVNVDTCLQGLSVQEIRDVLTKGQGLTQLSDLSTLWQFEIRCE